MPCPEGGGKGKILLISVAVGLAGVAASTAKNKVVGLAVAASAGGDFMVNGGLARSIGPGGEWDVAVMTAPAAVTVGQLLMVLLGLKWV